MYGIWKPIYTDLYVVSRRDRTFLVFCLPDPWTNITSLDDLVVFWSIKLYSSILLKHDLMGFQPFEVLDVQPALSRSIVLLSSQDARICIYWMVPREMVFVISPSTSSYYFWSSIHYVSIHLLPISTLQHYLDRWYQHYVPVPANI